MHQEHSFNTTVCSEYERLLTVCQQALENWRYRREQITNSGSSGKQVAAELLRLQANFAKANAQLQQHKGNCELCCFVSKMGGHDFAGMSDAVLGKKCPA
jgi:hypothetical protein